MRRRNIHSKALRDLPGQVTQRLAQRPRTFFRSSRICNNHIAPDSSSVTSPPATSPRETVASPFRFETGIALFAKRPPRPFPPPFHSRPSGSFSDPLSTHDKIRLRRTMINGEHIRGFTSGDDAVYASALFIGANDGVGAWSTRKGGHAGLWSRLIIHFWAMEIENDANTARPKGQVYVPDPIRYLQAAYEQTIKATTEPNVWQGTTTAAGAQLHYTRHSTEANSLAVPLLYVTNLGDSQIMVIRPSQKQRIYKTAEQWHWFDCPRQLGTNSPDIPCQNAILDKIEIQEDDIVLAMTDGVIDNLWEHEIISNVLESIKKWDDEGDAEQGGGGMNFVAERLMQAARTVALDPFAESPFMEHAIEEGLAMEGGKLDDISIVAARCTRSKG